MTDRIGDAPIDPKLHALMNKIAAVLDAAFNGEDKGDDRKNGFILMVFPFESHEGRCNYISNAKRDDIVVMLREQIRRFEGAPDAKGTA